MSERAPLPEALTRLARASAGQLAVRAGVLAATVGVLVAASVAGDGVGTWPTLGLLALAVLAAAVPDSPAGLALLLGLAWAWGVSVRDPAGPATPVVAALLLLVHVGMLLAAHGPPELRLDTSLLATWAWRVAGLAAATALIWLAVRLLDVVDPRPAVAATGAALAVVTGVLVTLALRSAPTGGGRDA